MENEEPCIIQLQPLHVAATLDSAAAGTSISADVARLGK
jgi:hypothetical protein